MTNDASSQLPEEPQVGTWVVTIPSFDRAAVLINTTLPFPINGGVCADRTQVVTHPNQRLGYETSLKSCPGIHLRMIQWFAEFTQPCHLPVRAHGVMLSVCVSSAASAWSSPPSRSIGAHVRMCEIISKCGCVINGGRALGQLKRRFKVPTRGLVDKKFPPPPVEVDGQAP